MEIAADWDLQAVVRGCTSTTTSSSSSSSSITTTTTTTTTSTTNQEIFPSKSNLCFSISHEPILGGGGGGGGGGSGYHFFSFPDPFEARNSIDDLHDLYKTFFNSNKSHQKYQQSSTSTNSTSPSSSSVSCLSVSKEQKQNQQQQQQQHFFHVQMPNSNNYRHSHHAPSVATTCSSSVHTPRAKKRKNQVKKICQVPAEALSSDVWAWRKYGQKPIKGSPYPRGYYRCSSSKSCLARKQVERNRSDPRMFILTYTAEHNHPAPTHRNSLAGSTRHKSCTPPQTSTTDSNKLSPEKPSCSSPEEEILMNLEEDKDMMLMEDDQEGDTELGGFSVDAGVSDDFFDGLEELVASF